MESSLNRQLSKLLNTKGSDDMNKEIVMLILQIIGMIFNQENEQAQAGRIFFLPFLFKGELLWKTRK